MSLQSQIVAQGVISTTAGSSVYTVPSGSTLGVTSILIANPSGSVRTINLYTTMSGGTMTQCSDKDKTIAAGACVELLSDATRMRLNAGQQIGLDVDSGTDVVYTVFGVLGS